MVLEGFVLAVWGVFVALVQERLGSFQDLSPNMKQLVNSIFAFIVPIVVQFVAPIWRPEFGDTTEVVTAFLTFVVPALFVWVSGQFGHHFDNLLNRAGKRLKG